LKRKTILPVIVLIFAVTIISGQQVIRNGKTLYLANTLILKVKSGVSQAQLNKALTKFSVNNISEMFNSQNILNKGTSVLSGIYKVNYSTGEDPISMAKKIARMPNIQWAEPRYVRTVTYTPNDSIYNVNSYSQANLKQINADKAWDVTKGNKNVIIGIVDTGVDWTHPDLTANIYKVNGALIPGSDLGGTSGTPDNDPSEDILPNNTSAYHGTHVAGIASASTDNTIGVASVGFNCSILPVKASRNDQRDASTGEPYIYYGIEGIKWAVDNGAKVINCSWGGYSFSSYEQSIIDYAISNGAVVVAAQGNDGSSDSFYPADYKGVLSVGWLDTGVGVKNVDGWANYGENVKVFAPGTFIISTWQRQTTSSAGAYRMISGSSMSTPHVSGLAGLVWSKFPYFTPLQVEERIRVTSDNIDSSNPDSMKYLLGHGIINAAQAVDGNVKATSVRADSVTFIDLGNGNGILEPGEEVAVKMNFTNYLATVSNVTVTLSTTDSYVSIENGIFNTGVMDTLTTISNMANEFKFKIGNNTPLNHKIHFLLSYSNGIDYTDYQWTDVKVNPTYDTHNNSLITLSITSNGNLAYNDYPNNLEGNGFKYKNSENLMFEGAFMYVTGPTKIMNEARILNSQKQDFVYSVPMKTTLNGTTQTGYNVFSDLGDGTNALGIETTLSSYSYSQAPDNNYIILKSSLHNKSTQNISGLFAGYFIDWDIPESGYDEDTTYFDNTNNIAIAYNAKNSTIPYTGTALISTGGNFGYYGIDNSATTGNVVMGDNSGFTDAEKWYALSNGIKNPSAGVGDISLVVSGGPYDIPANQSVDVAFAIAAGSTLDEVISAIQESRTKYQSITSVENNSSSKPGTYELYQNYPNPFNPSTIISYTLPIAGYTTLKVYDLLGREVAALVNAFQKSGKYNLQFSTADYHLTSGVYFYRITSGNYSQTRKMILLK
jgi:subtilisin family serine protease